MRHFSIYFTASLFLLTPCSRSLLFLSLPRLPLFEKTHKRIPRYDIIIVPAIATPFEIFAQSSSLTINGWSNLATSQRIPSLQRMPVTLMTAKRATSPPFNTFLCLNVQYLFRQKLLR